MFSLRPVMIEARDDRARVAGLDQLLLEVVVGVALDGRDEARAHLDAVGAKRHGGGDSAAVGNSARSRDGDVDGVCHLRHERDGRRLVHPVVAAGLVALAHDRVEAGVPRLLRALDRRDDVDDERVVALEQRRYLHRVARRSAEDAGALLESDLANILEVGSHHRNIDAPGLVGVIAHVLQVFAYLVPVHRAGSDEPEAASVRDGRRQPPVGYPNHSALDYRILYSKQLRQSCLLHVISPTVLSLRPTMMPLSADADA